MVEPMLSISMQTHPCYAFHQRMINCVKGEEMSSRLCLLEIEDWHECKSRRTHRAFHNFINSEMDKVKIYSLPTYDKSTDTFKDGPLPTDVDAYFAKPAAAQTYYS